MKLPSAIRGWLGQRFEIEPVENFVHEQLHKPLPQATGFWHTFGSLSLFLFVN